MSIDTSAHEDRKRSQKAFRTSLVYGVIIGGAVGASIEIAAEAALAGTQDWEPIAGMTTLLVIFSFVLLQIAFKKSSEMETRTMVHWLKQSSHKLETLIQGALDNVRQHTRLRSVLEDYLSLLSSVAGFKQANMGLLRDFSAEISTATPTRINRALRSHLTALHEYPTLMHNLFEELKTTIEKSKIFSEKQWESTPLDGGTIQVSKPVRFGRIRKIMDLEVHNNLENSIAVPFICYTRTNPSISNQEHVELRRALDSLFVEITQIPRRIELEVLRPEEELTLETLRLEIKDVMIERIDRTEETLTSRLDDIEEELTTGLHRPP